MSKSVKFSDALKNFSAPGFELLLLLSGIVALLLTARPAIISDGLVRYGVVHALLHADPLPRIKYSLVQPILSFPLGLVAQSMHADAQDVVAYFNICVFCVLGAVLFRMLCVVYSRRQAVRVFILLLGASMFPHYLRYYYGEVFSALCIGAGFALSVRNAGWTALPLGLGIANTPPLLIPVVLASVFFRQRWAVLGSGVGLGLVLIGAENFFKYGSLLNVAYLSEIERGFATVLPYSGRPGFSYPLFFGVLSVLFSFGKGLVFFIPGLFLLISERVRAALKMSVAMARSAFVFCAALVLVYAGWWAWYGGVCWGPRFFLILCVPASMAVAACLDGAWGARWSMLVASVLTLSTWVGVNGVVFGQEDMGMCWANNYELEFLCWYVPEFSALWRPFVVRGAGGVAQAMLHDDRAFFVLWQLIVFVYFLARVAVSALRKQGPAPVAASSGAA
jgi:hypothetical protein